MFSRSAIVPIAHYLVQIILMVIFTQWFPGMNYAIVPQLSPLYSIATAPLLHADWSHLLSNLGLYVPMVIALTILFEKRGILIYWVNYLVSGLLTWLLGDYAAHIGSSGVAIGLFFIILFAGIFSLDYKRILLSAFLAVYYYAVATEFYVENDGISTDYHICGFLSAVAILLYLYYPGRSIKFS